MLKPSREFPAEAGTDEGTTNTKKGANLLKETFLETEQLHAHCAFSFTNVFAAHYQFEIFKIRTYLSRLS